MEYNECIQNQPTVILNVLLLKIYEEGHYCVWLHTFSRILKVLREHNKILEETHTLLYKMYFILYYRIRKFHLLAKTLTQEQII